MYNRNWGQDRRRFQRLNLNLVVWFKALYPQQTAAVTEKEAVTLDLSPFGMAFMCNSNISLYSDLALKFIIFSSQDSSYSHLVIPIEVRARVKTCVPYENGRYRVGVSFQNIQLETQQKLARFIRESMRAIV